MAMTVLNNTGTMMSLGELNKNISEVGKQLSKVSSGMRINSAKDDASGFSISEKMRTRIRGLEQASQNLQNGMSLVKVGLGGMQEITNTISTMREMALAAANDTMTDLDRKTSQKVLDQMIDNIDDIAVDTTYNGIHVLLAPPGKIEETSGTKGTAGEADFVFVVDTTGSMGGHIARVADHIRTFTDSLDRLGVDARYGVVAYGDVRPTDGADPVTKCLDFTGDADELESALRSMPMTGGGDWPESGLDGIMDPENGAMSFLFRDTAAKHVIVLTDAPAVDVGDDPGATYSFEETVAALNAWGIRAHVISHKSGRPYDEWSYLMAGTGGEYFDIAGDYGKELEKLAEFVSEDLGGLNGGAGDFFRIHDDTKANQNIRILRYDHRAVTLGLRTEAADGRYDTIKIVPREKAVASLAKLDAALNLELGRATTWGSYISRMEHAYDNVITAGENTQGAESTLRDADMAKEMMGYTKANVLFQASQSMLAQANQNLSSVLSLLQ